MEAVIFDMDGVLIDSHSVALHLLCDTANSYGCNLTPEEIHSWGSLSSRQFWTKVKEEHQLPQEVHELIKSYNVDQEIIKYEEIGLIPGVKDLLKAIKESGIKTALATSASKKRMQAVIEMFGLSSYFDQCVCDNEVNQSKPDPEIFLLAANKLKVSPQLCVVIEDSRNGLLSAKAAGMICIAYKGLIHVKEDMTGADMEITSFMQIQIDDFRKWFKEPGKR
ncbi:HAD family hydrolase [Paenibacillus eucommiae]|uniref:HAD superfamily hydrolase (TIGR01509 family) n=1 Tax=Paenibacillus eucommiae TaxID=1355755 RepID=A0ABS4IQH9_9BACL|nr:HAD-IA family hydrolase [Paenibacillus eucommiae]MBP1989814.1 HAD superfamily hydrolase (TIGR01509 family) [Paenibacillus eucommiae]